MMRGSSKTQNRGAIQHLGTENTPKRHNVLHMHVKRNKSKRLSGVITHSQEEKNMIRKTCSVFACALIFFCGVWLLAGTAGADSHKAAISAAVANSERPAKDRERDANRKPESVLAFFGIGPGMTVLDMFAGGGYYTEILSRTVGADGKVYAQNNLAYRQYAADELATRYVDDRLANVERLDIEVEDLALPSNSLDAATLVLSYHDIYYVVTDGSWPKIDGSAMLAEILDALKPGAVLGVVDHTAKPGGDVVEVATNLHRIEKATVICEITGAGFALTGKLDVLANPDDPLDIGMFDPAIQGNTDRFVLRFEKPARGAEAQTICD